MNYNLFELEVKLKKKTSKAYSIYNRKNNLIPCNIYSKTENIMGLIDKNSLEKALASKTLFNQFTKIKIEDKEYIVYAKVVQKHPVTEQILHIDFIIVKEDEVIKMNVPVKFLNKDKCEVIKLGAVLNIIHPNILIKAKVKDMPNYLYYDLSNANGKESLLLSKIELPKNIKIASTFKSNVIGTILNARKKAASISTEEEKK